jgi:hypothetical protein
MKATDTAPQPENSRTQHVVDHSAVRDFLQRISEQAQRALRGVKSPGLLQISRLHPADNKLVPTRYKIGDIDRMVEDAVVASDAGHNVYIEGRTVRADLGRKERGAIEDTVAVFAFVIDSDADHGMTWTDNGTASMTVETSPGNAHYWLFLDQALPTAEGKELGGHIRVSARADHDTGTITQPYRVAGTINFPSKRKQDRGRVVTPTRLICTSARLWTRQQITEAFPQKPNGGGNVPARR